MKMSCTLSNHPVFRFCLLSPLCVLIENSTRAQLILYCSEDPAEVPEHPSLRRAAAPQGPLQPLSKFCSLGSAAAAGPRKEEQPWKRLDMGWIKVYRVETSLCKIHLQW